MIAPGLKRNENLRAKQHFGVWLFNDGGLCPMCSHCDKFAMDVTNYCPNCGAEILNTDDAIFFQNKSLHRLERLETEMKKND